MPIYEYRCDDCRATFEQRRSFRQTEEAVACPTCGSAAERQMSRFVFALGDARAVPSGSSCACGGTCACAG